MAQIDEARESNHLVRQKVTASVPRVRRPAWNQAAATGGSTVELRARFGCTAAGGSTDDGRFRRLTVHLPAVYAQRLPEGRGRTGPQREG